MKVIVPCCGKSSRYPTQAPKWMLPAHDGRPMLSQTLSGIRTPLEDVVVTILREHEDKYDVTRGLANAFDGPIRTVVLDEPTRSQPHTIAETIRALDLDEAFLIKDSDNTFVLDDVTSDTNYVCVDSLNNHDSINPRNKSYLQVDHRSMVTNIREKVVISDLFSVGGYGFLSPAQFLAYYERLTKDIAEWQRELYTSDIIGAMLLDGQPFHARQISGYQDWGTIHEWRRALLTRNAYFVSIDGFLFERGSQHFTPRFSEVAPNAGAMEAVRELVARGHSLIYLSIRSSEDEDVTRRQLREQGLPEGPIVFSCPVASWTLLTAPHQTLPFKTSHASELPPEDPNLLEKLLDGGV